MRYTLLALLLLLAFPALAQQTPISALTGAGPLQPNDLFPLDQRVGNTTTPSHVPALTMFNQGMALAIGTASTGLPYVTNGSFGVVNTTNAQAAINKINTTGALGTSGYQVVPCTGNDATAFLNAAAASSTANKGAMVYRDGCLFTSQWQMPNSTSSAIFGFGNYSSEYNTIQGGFTGPGSSIMRANLDSINANAPGETAIDMHGSVQTTFNGANFLGTGSSNKVMSALVGNSSQNGGCCNVNTLNVISSSMGDANTIFGCPMDANQACVQAGGVKTGTFVGGTGYVDGTYTNVPLTGGAGTNATAISVVVSGGIVIQVNLFTSSAVALPGGGYAIGNVLGASNANLGGTGSGFQFTVTSIYSAGFTSANTHAFYVNSFFSGISGTALSGNFTDARIVNNTFTSGQAISGQTSAGGGAGSEIGMNRFEDNSSAIVLNNGNSFITGNEFTHGPGCGGCGFGGGPDITLLGGSGYTISGNTFDANHIGPARSAAIELGRTGNLSNVTITGNNIAQQNQNTPYCIDIQSGHTVDKIMMIGNVCDGTTIIGSVNYEQVPAHFAQIDNWQVAFGGLPFGIGTSAPLATAQAVLDLEGTTSLHLPTGATNQRPGSPVTGMVRFNSTTGFPETFNGTTWISFGNIQVSTLANYKGGLTLTNDPTTPNTIIDIASGSANDDTNSVSMSQATNYTKTTGAWTLGTGNGCLDSGSVANNTWYAVYLVERSDGTASDILCSASVAGPLLPSGYSYKRYLESFKTDGSAHVVAFHRQGNTTLWDVSTLDANGVSVGTTAISQALNVPLGVLSVPQCSLSYSDTGHCVLVSSLSVSDQAPSCTLPFSASPGFTLYDLSHTAGITNTNCPYLVTDAAQKVRLRSDDASGTFSFVTNGWTSINVIPKVIILTSASSSPLVLPSDWNPNSNTIAAIGEGGNGSFSTGGGPFGAAGGGGGAYAQISNLSDPAGTSEAFTIGAGGTATSTQFKNGATLVAKFGVSASGNTGGVGGTTAASVGTIKFAGGAGPGGGSFGGSGGGGSGGPNGAGAGGGFPDGTGRGGAGGGAANGGTAGAAGNSSGTGGAGGSIAGAGSGSGGNVGLAGTAGSYGGGGGGTGANGAVKGGNGGSSLPYGPGGGGSGGGIGSGAGGDGGLYGGGGGGGGSNVGTGGLGASGAIIITYIPAK